MIGVGGGEFRLPVLLFLHGLLPRAAVPMNLVVSFVTLVGALTIRAGTLSLAPLTDMPAAVGGLMIGSLIGAFVAPGILRRLSERSFTRVLAVLLFIIAAALIGEALVPVEPLRLVPADALVGLAAGIGFGAVIGVIAALLGIAGGEFLIPTLILVYGASATAAGTASLAISIVAVAAALLRYGRLGLLPAAAELRRIAAPMGLASIVGAVPGGILAAYAPDAALKVVLGFILIAAAGKSLRDSRV